jgi:hypothetical protein
VLVQTATAVREYVQPSQDKECFMPVAVAGGMKVVLVAQVTALLAVEMAVLQIMMLRATGIPDFRLLAEAEAAVQKLLAAAL